MSIFFDVSDVFLAVFFVCVVAAKMRGDPRWRRGWRVRYAVACLTLFLVGLAADLPGYVFVLVCVPVAMARWAVERREETRVEG